MELISVSRTIGKQRLDDELVARHHGQTLEIGTTDLVMPASSVAGSAQDGEDSLAFIARASRRHVYHLVPIRVTDLWGAAEAYANQCVTCD
jgi:hypothetical protein